MDVSPFLALPVGLVIEAIVETDTSLTILVQATAPTACCPLCQMPSAQIHSVYQRTVADLPCGGRQVILRLSVRKFFCLNLACSRQIFTERLPDLVQPWAHRTTRLLAALRAIGFATSGEAGARLAPRLGMTVSPSTLLRQMKATPVPKPGTTTKVGIDDFALRRGRTYGTILVDLETHRVVDLLPDRSAATATVWFQARPDIDTVSRDRGTDYAAAATLGAPQAIQIADRWHLVKNLAESLYLLLARCRPEIRKYARALAAPAEEGNLPTSHDPETAWGSNALRQTLDRQARQAQRLDCYQQVVTFQQQGWTAAQIAEHVGMSRRTVYRWLARGSFPATHPRRKRPRVLLPYLPYLLQRWEEGCHNGVQLLKELRAQGYSGAKSTMYRYLASLRPSIPLPAHARRPIPPPAPYENFSPKQAVWLLVRDPADLKAEEQAELAFLRQASQEVEAAYQLTQAFLTMLHERRGAQLDQWLAAIAESRLPELVQFKAGIERDKAAVQAGLSHCYSNGVVEGHVHRLKLVKRQMFGRAGFPLLRQRVLYVG